MPALSQDDCGVRTQALPALPHPVSQTSSHQGSYTRSLRDHDTRKREPRQDAQHWTSARPGPRPVGGCQLTPYLLCLPLSHLLQDQTGLSQMPPIPQPSRLRVHGRTPTPGHAKPGRSSFHPGPAPNAHPEGCPRGLGPLPSGRPVRSQVRH